MNSDFLYPAGIDSSLKFLFQKSLGNREQWFIRFRFITIIQIITDIFYKKFRNRDVTDAFRCLGRRNNVFPSQTLIGFGNRDTTKLTPAFEVRLYTLYRQKQSRDIFKDHVLRKMGAKS